MTGFSLPTVPEECPDQHRRSFKGVSRILGPKWTQLPTITIGMLGVQILWSVEMSYGVCGANDDFFGANDVSASPYLLSLGLSKSSMAVVFVAGPLSGLIMQPLIGTWHSTIKTISPELSTIKVYWQTALLQDLAAEDLTCYSELSFACWQCFY